MEFYFNAKYFFKKKCGEEARPSVANGISKFVNRWRIGQVANGPSNEWARGEKASVAKTPGTSWRTIMIIFL
jgi:hypothetical protein